MDLIQAVVLGLIQGLTEFLPISSSGHLFLLPDLLHWNDAGAGFTAVIQLGTILAVLIYFRHDLARTLKGWTAAFSDPTKRNSSEARLAWGIVLGTIPISVCGLALEKKIDTDFRSAVIVSGTLISFALLLWAAEAVGKRKRGLSDVTVKDGIVIGLWQCLALVPGSSRSGCTITGALFSGMDRATAARYSFLLSIPAVILSGLYKMFKERHELLGAGAVPTLVATVVAFVTGYWSISFLMKYLQTRSTGVFIVYRIVLGLLILTLLMAGVVRAKPTSGPTAFHTHGIHQAASRA